MANNGSSTSSDTPMDVKQEQIVIYNKVNLDTLISGTYNNEDDKIRAVKILEIYGDIDNPLYEFNSIQDAIRVMSPDYTLSYKPEETAKFEHEPIEYYIKNIFVRDLNGNAKKVKVFTEDGFYDYLFKARNVFAKRFRKFVRIILHKLRIKGSVTINEAVAEYKIQMQRIEQENEQMRIKLLSSENKIAKQDLVVREYQERIKNLDTNLNSELMENRLRAVVEDEELKFQKICVYAATFELYSERAEDVETKSIIFTLEGETAEEIKDSSQPYAFYFRAVEAKEKPGSVEKKIKDQYGDDVTIADEKNEILISYVKIRVDKNDEKKDTKIVTIKKLLEFLDKECKVKQATKTRKTYVFCDYNLLKTYIDIYNYKEIDEKFLKERE
jgi:prophage antirepressor-like protein